MTLWISTLQLPAHPYWAIRRIQMMDPILFSNRWTKPQIYCITIIPMSLPINESWYVEQTEAKDMFVSKNRYPVTMMSIFGFHFIWPL